jgi:hypothetical protein
VQNPADPAIGSFPNAEEAFAKAHQNVEKDANERRPPNVLQYAQAMADADRQMTKLSADLKLVLNAMQAGISEAKLIAMLATMERIQADRSRWLEAERLRIIDDTLRELIGDSKDKKK